MSNLKYKHTAYTSAQWASLNPVIVENEIVIESDTKRTKIGNGISTYNELEYADANSVGNSLGPIKPTDAAPTPARNGNYTFSIGGDKPAWLTAEVGVTTVKAGDGVSVVYAEPSSYTYTHVDVSSDFVTVESIIPDINNSSFDFCDPNGNVIVKVDSNGVKSYAFLDKNGVELSAVRPKIIFGKEFFTIGDSLSIGGVWQQKLATLSGAKFDNSKNILESAPLSIGGTRTSGVNNTCGQWRAKSLSLYNPSVIFIENINDLNKIIYKGLITDTPFMLLNIITYGSTFNSWSELNTWLSNGSFTTYLETFAAIDRKIGSGIRFPFLDAGVTIYNEYIFDSKNVADWTNTAKWAHEYTQCTLYKAYKGLLEYLIETYPTASIYWMMPTRFGFDWTNSSYLNADGSFNADNYKQSSDYMSYKELVAVQKAVCEYYQIPYMDVDSLSGITANNASAYYQINNVHPLTVGYERWGETIFRLI